MLALLRSARVSSCCSLAVALFASPVLAAEGPTVNVSINTVKMSMPGMPAMPALPPGIKLPPGVNMPGMMGMFQGRRSLTVSLATQGAAPDGATASMDLPDGLGVGTPASLDVRRPSKGRTGPGGAAGGGDMKVWLYWGCGDTVPAGQPKRIDMTSTMRRYMQQVNPRMGMAGDETFASYPSARDMMGSTIKADASAVGDYKLHTSYAGDASFHVGADQDFLDAIELVSPQQRPDLGSAISLAWKSVPHASGYQVMATGQKDDPNGGGKIMIMWFSSNEEPFQGEMLGAGDDAQRKALLSPDTTTCTVPAGILQGVQGAILMVMAHGHTRTTDGNPGVRVTNMSTTSMMLAAPGGRRGGGGSPFGQ